MYETGQKFTCPCCGYRVFRLPPGCHESCPICGWEDDLTQLRFPRMPGAANRASLQQSQQNYVSGGAAAVPNTKMLRSPVGGDLRDTEWRPLKIGLDYMEEPCSGIKYQDSYPEDTTLLYYWRSTFWHSRLS